MRDLYVVSGRLAEVHRFINVPMRWFEEYPARERRELWIATPEGQEVKLVVHSRLMPARCGHHVEALLYKGELVGLLNRTTGAQVNYSRVDPPLVWRRFDSLSLTLLIAAAFVAAVVGSAFVAVLVSMLTAAALSLIAATRLASNVRMRVDVDRGLETVLRLGVSRPLLRRVK